jgi:tRNA nucleotidyltransferase/poly(A) polymerase
MPDLHAPQSVLDSPWRAPLREAATGHQVHAVGGAVRDAYLGGARAADLDVTVDRDAETLARRLAERLPARLVQLGQKEHAALRLIPLGDRAARFGELDLWDRQGGSLRADLERRDLTVHAIAIDLEGGGVEDPLRGLDDLARGILRDTTPRSLAEDPQRAVRLARFAAQFPDFSIDPGTLDRAAIAAEDLDRVAAERVRTELSRWAQQTRFAVGARVLARLGPFSEVAVATAALDQLERLLAGDQAAGDASPVEGRGDRETEQEAALWLVLAARAPRGFAAWVAKEWVERATEREIARRARWPAAPDTVAERREWIHRAGPAWRSWLLADLAIGHASPQAARRALDGFAELAADATLFGDRGAVDGAALRALGIAPGRALGEILAEIRRREVRGEWSDRQAALDWARERWQALTSGSAAGSTSESSGAD